MFNHRKIVNSAPHKLAECLGKLRPWALGLAALSLLHCAEEEPHYLPPLPDMSTTSPSGLPCEVTKLFADRCLGCHGLQPINTPPLSLVTYANLTATSTTDPTKKVIERAIQRMQDTTDPMPPGPTATVPPSELVPLQSWVAAGTPMTTCTSAARAPHPQPTH